MRRGRGESHGLRTEGHPATRQRVRADEAQRHAARALPRQCADARRRGSAGKSRAYGLVGRRQRQPGHSCHPADGADRARGHADPLARLRRGGGQADGARRHAEVGEDHGDDDVRPDGRSRARADSATRVRRGEGPAERAPHVTRAEDVKPKVTDAIDRLADDLERLSHRIHDTPELAFKEENAHAWLTEFLEKHGARVERGVGGLPTAFRATIPGTGPGPHVAIMAEYDALPGIGHACGHNVIATAGTGAGAALAVALGTLPFAGEIQVIGTPAEEGGAGKVKLMEVGVFHDVDAAMMIHGRSGTRVWRPSLGIIKVTAEFFGTAAHASSWPWRGVNALNAVIQLFVALDAMRQQLRQDARMHGVIVKGGEQPNIIPEYTRADFYLRSLDRDYCDELLRRFQGAAEGAGTATGC